MALRDYEDWLTRYDDPDSRLSWRLALIQKWLRADLDRRSGDLSVVSPCSGDGRDIIDVLAARDDADRVSAVLLESHPRVADAARRGAARAGVKHVTVRTCDAAASESFEGAVPADIVLLVGMLGNMSHRDAFATIAATPQFCAEGGTLLWSRGRDRDDINVNVRQAFVDAGFVEVDYRASEQPTLPAAGVMRYAGSPAPLIRGQNLFRFFR